uniref:Uncharacterized protein n=1 Tax=viral metagenome TaxID=1070528 RepID=A0A6C0J5G0_9ZZZZ
MLKLLLVLVMVHVSSTVLPSKTPVAGHTATFQK